MIGYEQALQYIQSCKPVRNTAVVALNNALGKICAETIHSPCEIPAFDNSAMDGFAVRSTDTLNITADNPLTMPVAGSTVAGDAPSAAVARNAWEITTGAPVPRGYDSIVMIERVKITATQVNGRPAAISISAPVHPNENIRRAGEDFTAGDTVITTGERVMPQHIMALAALGVGNIRIQSTPKVAVISTGKELVDDHQATLRPGQIRNANGPYLITALHNMRVDTHYAGLVPDEPDLFAYKLRKLSTRADIVLSTGAVSAGHHDFIPESLRRLGAEILFHKVAIRPGKPILFARLPNGALYLGLPGNPVSAAVGLRFFLYPLLCALSATETEAELPAKLESPAEKKPGLRFFQKACLRIDESGQRRVRILDGQESFKVKPMLHMNCWAILDEHLDHAPAGATVKVANLYPGGLL
jgi:molybdopterin molybdotransferase